MSGDCPPLPEGSLLAGRFVVGPVLGRGAFGIAYRGEDLRWGNACAIKELAPKGARRLDQGLLELPGDKAYRRKLRDRLLAEAERVARLKVPGLLRPRAWFVQNGTAYVVSDHAEGAVSLERRLSDRGPLAADEAVEIALKLLDTLRELHRVGILHRDVKPSNILLGANREVWLIDFGAALEWHADSVGSHSVLFTPGYAPPEQLDPRGVRGPATDVYAVAATLFEMLAGEPPPSSEQRVAGGVLPSLKVLRRDIDPSLVEAIEAGLDLAPESRPQTAEEFAALLRVGAWNGSLSGDWRDFDDRAARLEKFRFSRWQCPCCGGVLERVHPLRAGVCPVCRSGRIRRREVPRGVCPVCRSGALSPWPAQIPVCPGCRACLLRRRRGLLQKIEGLLCEGCGLFLEAAGGGRWRVAKSGQSGLRVGDERSLSEWLEASGRPAVVQVCGDCLAEFDQQPDGRWRQRKPEPSRGWESLYPEEWDFVAAGLEPGAGDSECDACGAEYLSDGDRVTLVGCHRDPYGFAERHQGRSFDWEHLRWVGVGKSSPREGLLCQHCRCEFDLTADGLRLVHGSGPLARAPQRNLSLEDWHRLAQGLPTAEEEEAFQDRFDEAIVQAYERGEIGVGRSGRMVWDGPCAWRLERGGKWSEGTGRLRATETELRLGRLARDQVVSLQSGYEVRQTDDDGLLIRTPSATLRLWPRPIVLNLRLASGTRKVPLDVGSLLERLRRNTGFRDNR
ncbi:MAG: serine/threonine protein kinase [Fimbriimonadales bacterium]|nr:serine/threonine protein kinase [Fimbriimonadales bacterium]